MNNELWAVPNSSNPSGNYDDNVLRIKTHTPFCNDILFVMNISAIMHSEEFKISPYMHVITCVIT